MRYKVNLKGEFMQAMLTVDKKIPIRPNTRVDTFLSAPNHAKTIYIQNIKVQVRLDSAVLSGLIAYEGNYIGSGN